MNLFPINFNCFLKILINSLFRLFDMDLSLLYNTQEILFKILLFKGVHSGVSSLGRRELMVGERLGRKVWVLHHQCAMTFVEVRGV